MDYIDEKDTDILDTEEFELILDPVEDKDFIEKWGLMGDIDSDFDVAELTNQEKE